MKIKKNGIILFVIVLFFICSCTSMQTEVKSTVSDVEINNITKEYEIELVRLDGRALALNDAGLTTGQTTASANNDSPKDREQLKKEVNAYLDKIQTELASPKMSRPLQCRLLALEGRAYLLVQNEPNAKKCYDQASLIEDDDIQVQILSLRLKKDVSSRLEQMSAVFTPETASLEIERAIAFYYMGQYGKAVASFDEAFAVLDHAYHDSYAQLRETSWLLQSAVGTVTADSTAAVLSAGGMLLLTQSETNLLLPVTGGRTLKAKELAVQMRKTNLLDETTAKKVDDRKAVLYRSDVAELLWKLYITYCNTNADVDYASQFAGQESPIADIKTDDASFNAIAGCVENEFMDLPDGIHFFPGKTVSGPEYMQMIKKVSK